MWVSTKHSTRMTGSGNSQYCFWLFDTLSLSRSWKRSLFAEFSYDNWYKRLHFITRNVYILWTWNFCAYKFNGRTKHATCSFLNLHKLLRYGQLKIDEFYGRGSTKGLLLLKKTHHHAAQTFAHNQTHERIEIYFSEKWLHPRQRFLLWVIKCPVLTVCHKSQPKILETTTQ